MAPGSPARGGPTADLAVAQRVVPKRDAGLAVAAGALIALACLSFLPAVWSSFVSDDFLLLHNLRHAGIGWAFSHNDAGEAGASGHFYRPVWTLWNLSLYKTFGASSTAFHAGSLLLYAVVVAEVWALAASFVDGTRAWIAAAAFAVYPRHGESVAWVSGNTDLLAVAAALGALLFVRAPFSRGTRLAGAVALTVVATLTKEVAFVLPVLALLVVPRRRDLVLPGAMAVAEIAVFALRYVEIGGVGGYSGYGWTLKRMLGSGASYAAASGLPPSVAAFRYPLIFLLPAALVALAVWRMLVLRRRGARSDLRLVGIGVAWFVVALLPLLSLPVDLNNANGERNLLLASVGLALALAGLVPVPTRPLGMAAVGASLAVMFALSLYSSFDWIEAGKLTQRLTPAAVSLAPHGGELVLLSAPEAYRTAHVFTGGDLSEVLGYRGDTGFSTTICVPVDVRSSRAGVIRFAQNGPSYSGTTSWAAPFDFPVLHSAGGLTGECAYSRLPGGSRPPGLGLRASARPTPSRQPVVFVFFDGHDLRRCC